MRGLLHARHPQVPDSQLVCCRHQTDANACKRRCAVRVLALAKPRPRISRDRGCTASTSCQPQELLISHASQRGATRNGEGNTRTTLHDVAMPDSVLAGLLWSTPTRRGSSMLHMESQQCLIWTCSGRIGGSKQQSSCRGISCRDSRRDTPPATSSWRRGDPHRTHTGLPGE